MKKVEVAILDFTSGTLSLHIVDIPDTLPNGQDVDEYVVEKLDIGSSAEYMIVDDGELVIDDCRV